MELFNKNAGMKLDLKVASADSLDAVKGKQGRICPLMCEQGYKADGDRCTKIICRAGFEVGDDNTCEKIEAKKKRPRWRRRDEPASDKKPAQNQSSVQPSTQPCSMAAVGNMAAVTQGSYPCLNSRPAEAKPAAITGNTEAVYARCRKKLEGLMPKGGAQAAHVIPFVQLEACVKSGG